MASSAYMTKVASKGYKKAHRLLTAVGAILLPLAAMALPAKPGSVTMTSATGSEINVRIMGDENFHYYLSDDGYLLLPRNGKMYYAMPGADGVPVASARIAADARSRSKDDQRWLQTFDADAMVTAYAAAAYRAQKPLLKGPGTFPNVNYPTTGNQKMIVVLVDFQDVKFHLPDPGDYFRRMLNEKGFSDYGATGSARDYYLDASGGLFDPQYDVYGPVTLPHDMAWYGSNSGASDNVNVRTMVVDACNLLDSSVDFSEYDRDNDGVIDNVFLFYAGLGEASGGGPDTVWPHQAEVLGTFRYDGKMLKTYGCTNEWIRDTPTTGHPDGIGAFCHEFGHILGLPDLYATVTVKPEPFTPGAWALMDVGPYNNNGRTPPALDLFSRYALGWWQPEIISSPIDGRIRPLADGAFGYMIPTADSNEYFLLENRQKTGWDKYVPGHGMLVWHIQYDAGVWMQHAVNNTASHQYVDILEADGILSNATRFGDTFPGTEGITSITGTTDPGFVTAAGNALDMEITDIQEYPDGIVVFKAMGGAEPASAVTGVAVTDVTPRSFKVRWDAAPEAVDYRINIYTRGENGNEPVNGYAGRSVGAMTDYVVTNLTPATDYYITVSAVTPRSIGLPSSEMHVSTYPLTPDYVIPEPPVATEVTDNSFIVNWQEVENASGYLLTVEKRNVWNAEEETESFDGKTVMWNTNTNAFYANDAYVGGSAPSLRLLPGDYVCTPLIAGGKARNFSFWHRGRNGENARISVDSYANGCWTELASTPLFTDKEGGIFSVNEFPEESVAVRICLYDATGAASAYVDDFRLVYGGWEQCDILKDFNSKGVYSGTSCLVDGLEPGSEYYFRVKAIFADNYSMSSPNGYAKTSGEASVESIVASPATPEVRMIPGGISVRCDNGGTMQVYDFTGRCVVSMPVSEGWNSVSLSRGIYIVRLPGGATVKTMVTGN